MKTNSLLFILTSTLLSAMPLPPMQTGNSVVAHDKSYYKHKMEKYDVELIYTKDNINFAKQATNIEGPLHDDYEKFFNWKLDERLYVGLISDYNQVANGFSTQWPNNRQINYVGGTQLVDYFSTTSWLDTLLYHESAHNYQMNVKGSPFSRTIHKYLGNGTFMLPIFIATPNVFENSFMLEGNAVFNESWHGNGGRLYSGRFRAETLLQAKADNINASYMYNSRLAFPYGENYYIQGGFYNLYLAKKYGIKQLDSYFTYHSQDWWWPFRTNASMRDAVGQNFEKTLSDFSNEQKKLAENFVSAQGKRVASSQFFSSLGNSDDAIFFISNETGVREPELVVLDKKSQKVTKKRDSWISGKVLRVNGKYYTQGSRKTSPLKIYQGLFSSSGFIKSGTESKMVQGYLSDKRAVYFDVASSYSEPQLYVGNKFYTQVNSSVIIDKEDNLYYFKQKGKTRTLYKNRTPLYSYKGFYGIVSDVDSRGSIYFIANSKLGSTLYKYDRGFVTRVSDADNIVEARLVNDDEVLLAAISDKDYYYVVNKLISKDEMPYDTKLFFEKRPYYGAYKRDSKEKLDLNSSYSSVLDMHYSGSDASLILSSNGFVGSFDANFGDPLSQNASNLFVSRDDTNVTIAGAGYSNSQYLLNYKLIGYGVLDKDGRKDVRDGGIIASAHLPFLEAGYFYGAFGINYYQDFDTSEREPLSATLTLYQAQQFGVSMYENYLHYLQLYAVKEREDKIVGGEYAFEHDLPAEFYLGVDAKYSQTDNDSCFDARGVKMNGYVYAQDMDPSTLSMPSLTNAIYVKSAGFGEVSLKKVFNQSAYFFTFPFSLQRESVYTKYRYYDIKDFSDNSYKVDEATLGLRLSTVFLNSFSLPISIEYLYNDASFIRDRHQLRVLLGASF